ncbi:MAG TPA: nucleotidyltransferase family protein [Blastocatellia bacterium]|nr:nucleotidyltransferase family protein [Blastocatellia bacterium]
MISAILLAAGESRRMGDFKQLLPIGNKTFVEQCVDTLLETPVSEVIVVTGHRESDVRRVLGNRNVKYAHNPDYRLGMATSIKCGVQAASKDSRAFLISLVDQPHIGAEVIRRIIDAYERMTPKIVVPTKDGRNGHPIILDGSLREEILQIDVEVGLRQVVNRHSDTVIKVEVTSRTVLEDCDLPEDYERIIGDLQTDY